MIIGITGYARSGKSTAASHLVIAHGYDRKHIATPIRMMLAELLRTAGYNEQAIYSYLEGDWKETIIPFFGRSGRDMQISLGTEWGREMVNRRIWVDLWERGIEPDQKVLNDSVRFWDEEDAIVQNDGIIIRIVRPGVGPAKFKYGPVGRLMHRWTGIPYFIHPSERVDLIDADYEVVNDGTIENLHRQIDEIIAREKNHA